MPDMARSPVLELAQAATDGQLFPIIVRFRSDGFSYDRIAAELASRYQLIVTGPTVKAWLDLTEGPAA